jgi:hypothetical protein
MWHHSCGIIIMALLLQCYRIAIGMPVYDIGICGIGISLLLKKELWL